MSEREGAPEIQRILVAIDASPHSQAALQAAVEMAVRFEAELVGLFVEDINLLRAAALPFARELGIYSARRRRMSPETMERHLRARVRQIERLFYALAEREAVRGSFRVVRGSVGPQIHTAAEDVDVLIIGRVGWSQMRGRQVGSTALAACCDRVPHITVILQEGDVLSPPVTVVYDGSPTSELALATAAELVDDLAGPLQVLLLAEKEAQLAELRARAGRILSQLGGVHRMSGLVAAGLSSLVQAIYALESRTIVVPTTLPHIMGEAVRTLLTQIDMPVVLVR